MSDASKIKYVCIHLVSFALFNDGVPISECRHSLIYVVVFYGMYGSSRIVRNSELVILMVEYIGTYKAVQLKSKMKHKGT